MARVVVPGVVHHVTQRGNNRQAVFFTDDDRRYYLTLLRAQSERWGLVVHGYCLMPNHVHLIVTPEKENSLARGVGRTHWLYAQTINRLHGRIGHLWQGRFFSAALDETYFLAAMCYVERNPVRARLTRRAWTYAWSSAQAHMGQPDASGVLDFELWRAVTGRTEWKKVLEKPEDDMMITAIRRSLDRGRPLGTDRFVARLESAIGRRLRPLAIGRPRKPKTAKSGPRRKKSIGK